MKKIFLSCLLIGAVVFSRAQERGIINNSRSDYVSFKSIDIGDCRWTEGFWADKFQVAAAVMQPYMASLLKGDIGHAYNNFKIAAGLKKGEHKGFWWHDGDFYKWIEASVYIYAINKDSALLTDLDKIITVIGKAQLENGYLSTPMIIKGIPPFSNRRYHELYNSGHLLTAACIHHRVTGQHNFLDIARKHADHLYDQFHPQPPELARFGFNQTQIMGLVELYRTTQDKKYLELAEIFINMRGKSKIEHTHGTKGYPIGDMVQERVPLREETEAVGHAVLALYYYAGAADVYAETGEKALIEALDRLWDNVVNHKMYVTGAVGQAHHGASSRKDLIQEGFLGEYTMPNLNAYNETCANICNAMFSQRMLSIRGGAKYADVMELVLFNSALSGISLKGKSYFYSNPLRKIAGALDYDKMNTEFPVRQSYLKCFCCPPNLLRTIVKSSAWAYSKTLNGISVNLYGGNELQTTLLDGSVLRLEQKTLYPWEGQVTITVKECKKEAFDILLRIPDWAGNTRITVNGATISGKILPRSFAKLKRKWRPGDVIRIEMPMDVQLMEGHARIEEVRNQVAIKRGPVVYCL
ncbi:MAG: beta-L-arabinofuranosidase domain-containing protein, partial [Bacteroidota bacterium]